MEQLPLGSEEGLHLEFKSAAALKAPDIIARGVVAFLNGSGGSLWVGIAEDGQGHAKSLEPIAYVEAEKLRLQNVMVDTIEPAPVVGDEVTLSVTERQGNAGLLHIRVKRGTAARGPFAVLDKGRRGYFKRTGSRVRNMTREELAAAFAKVAGGKAAPNQAVQEAEKRLLEWTKSSQPALRMLVMPVGGVEIKVDATQLSYLLMDASRTGNREAGWTFVSQYSELRPRHPNVWQFGKHSDVQWLEISQATGAIEFFSSRERLHWQGGSAVLWPFALLELPASVARLAKHLYFMYGVGGPPAEIVLALGVYRIGDCTLRPRSPESIGYQMPFRELQTLAQMNDRDYFSSTPVAVTWEELNTTPDRCGIKLVRQLYRDFGYLEDKLPREYNPETGVLSFPR